MKKETNYYKNKVKRKSTGLPMDDLEKKLEEFKSKLRKELAEAKQEDKKKKVK